MFILLLFVRFTELKEKYPVEYIAGGAAQNSIRAAQWMLQTPGACSYIGCVGNDENGKELKKAAEKDGLRTLYLVDNEKPTGTCACLIKDKERCDHVTLSVICGACTCTCMILWEAKFYICRSLVANLGAAEAYKIDHLLSQDVQAVLNKVRVTPYHPPLSFSPLPLLITFSSHPSYLGLHFLLLMTIFCVMYTDRPSTCIALASS